MRHALLRLPLSLQMLAATLPLDQRDSSFSSSTSTASPRLSAVKKSLCLLCRSAQTPPRLLLLCGHAFHMACARAYIDRSMQCPLCKWSIVAAGGAAAAV